MARRCDQCGDSFDGEHWQRLCWSCWRSGKDDEIRTEGYDEGYAAGYAEAQARGYRSAYRRGYEAGLAAMQIDPDLLRDLVWLCHPDHHPQDRFSLANAVTTRLNGLAQPD